MSDKDQEEGYIYTRSQREARENGSDMTRYMSRLQAQGYGKGYVPYDDNAGDGGGGPVVWYRYRDPSNSTPP